MMHIESEIAITQVLYIVYNNIIKMSGTNTSIGKQVSS